jgi:hypothetical protein
MLGGVQNEPSGVPTNMVVVEEEVAGIKSPWTPEEDAMLLKLVEEQGPVRIPGASVGLRGLWGLGRAKGWTVVFDKLKHMHDTWPLHFILSRQGSRLD